MKKTQRSFNSTIRKSALSKKTNPARRAKPMNRVNRIRKATSFARAYGSHERVLFVKSLPCAACGVVGYSENAHLLGNGGTGRKADADTIGPLCGQRWTGGSFEIGCHNYYDEHRWMFDMDFPGFDPERVAAITELAWRASLGSAPGGHQK